MLYLPPIGIPIQSTHSGHGLILCLQSVTDNLMETYQVGDCGGRGGNLKERKDWS
jgi:hypothetical protein